MRVAHLQNCWRTLRRSAPALCAVRRGTGRRIALLLESYAARGNQRGLTVDVGNPLACILRAFHLM